jgi:3-hydroxy acid dehydrogenase/malonic semialdehyde reductase
MDYPRYIPKTVLITGATSGFGRAAVIRFLNLGCDVIAHGRDEKKLSALQKDIGSDQLSIMLCDMSDTKAIEAAAASLPAIDVLVNNAGLAQGLDPAHQADLDDWDCMIDTNIRGLVHMTRHIVPGMVARQSGHIINIGSMAGNWPYPGGNVYGATKAFVRQFSLNLRADLHGTKLRVTNIEPGLAETNFSVLRFKGDAAKAKAIYDGTTPLNADDVAETILWVATLPEHVNINSLEVMPTSQSFNALNIHRQKG